MSYGIAQYKDEISALNALHSEDYMYNTILWSKLNPNAKILVSAFENRFISRNDVLSAFSNYYEGKCDYLYPFTLTMIWGFAANGYGTFRTNNYLSSEENKSNIKNAFDALKANNQKDAFKYLMKIKGLSISYVSKLLYFATRALNYKNYALIFDIRVARALVKVVNNDGIEGLLEINPSKKYKDYINYNNLIHRWSKELNVEAENIEVFLFNGKF